MARAVQAHGSSTREGNWLWRWKGLAGDHPIGPVVSSQEMRGLELGGIPWEGWHELVPLAHSGGRKRKEGAPTGRKEQAISPVEGGCGAGRLGRLRFRKNVPPCLLVSDTLLLHKPASLAPTIPAASRSFGPEVWKVGAKPSPSGCGEGMDTLQKSLS